MESNLVNLGQVRRALVLFWEFNSLPIFLLLRPNIDSTIMLTPEMQKIRFLEKKKRKGKKMRVFA